MERLTGLDASFLYVETPSTPMHVAMLAVLDPPDAGELPLSMEALTARIEERLHLVPPFTRRLATVPLELHHPVWIDDPDFDLIHHVRRADVPAPGDPRALGDMVGRIASTPLDRARPLWEAWLLEGLEGGRRAVLVKMHHAAVDGITGAGLLVHLFDTSPTPRQIAPPDTPREGERPDALALLRHAIAARLRQPFDAVALAARTVARLRRVVGTRLDKRRPDGATPWTAPRAPFNASVTASRSVAFTRLALADVKAIKDAAGVKVNDAILGICAGALRRYLGTRGDLPAASLVAVCPISVRHEAPGTGEANNQVSALFASLATDVDDPAERLRRIARSTAGAKHEHDAIGADLLMNWAELATPAPMSAVARFYSWMRMPDRHRPIYNLVVSNVPGPPFPIYIAGARLASVYPMGPVLDGAGLNITVMSYRGTVDFGFMAATNLVPDVWDLAEAVPPACAELLAAVRA